MSVCTASSKSITMTLHDWGLAMELAKKYHQKSLSRVMAIAVRKVYCDVNKK